MEYSILTLKTRWLAGIGCQRSLSHATYVSGTSKPLYTNGDNRISLQENLAGNVTFASPAVINDSVALDNPNLTILTESG